MGAHVTADITEQWVHVALPKTRTFVPRQIAELVPDCGFELRRIEVEADGELRPGTGEADAAPRFHVSGSQQVIRLSTSIEQRGAVRLRGRFEAPIGDAPKLIVDSVEAR